MTTIKYTESPAPWGSPTGIDTPVQRYIDPPRWVMLPTGRTKLNPGDLWVQTPDSRYVRIARNGRLLYDNLSISDAAPGTLEDTDELPFTYQSATVGKHPKHTYTIYLDGKRIEEPLVIVPGLIYMSVESGKPPKVQEYYYTYGLRTEVVYHNSFDEYQCGQKIRVSFYTKGLTLLHSTSFAPSRKRDFYQRIMGYYILHQLRTH